MNIFKRNQVVITALVIMIVIAGYLSFTQRNTLDPEDITEAGANVESPGVGDISEEVQRLLDEMAAAEDGNKETPDTPESPEGENVGENDPDDGTESVDAEGNDTAETPDGEDTAANTPEEGIDTTNPGEAIFTSASIKEYVIQARFYREQARAKSKETLELVLNSTTISDSEKKDAIAGVLNMATRIEQEAYSENLLQAKGFSDVVVMIGDDKVDVIVSSQNLSDSQRAQIEDIVKRNAGVSADKIVITPINIKN